MRSLIRSFVEQRGYETCGEAENGVQAITQAKALQPDLILLDLSMPELNGAEAASILKIDMPDTPIIVFTMYDFGEKLASAIGVMVLSKADGFSKLAEAMAQLFGPPQLQLP